MSATRRAIRRRMRALARETGRLRRQQLRTARRVEAMKHVLGDCSMWVTAYDAPPLMALLPKLARHQDEEWHA